MIGTKSNRLPRFFQNLAMTKHTFIASLSTVAQDRLKRSNLMIGTKKQQIATVFSKPRNDETHRHYEPFDCRSRQAKAKQSHNWN